MELFKSPDDFTHTIALLPNKTGIIVKFENFKPELNGATILVQNTSLSNIQRKGDARRTRRILVSTSFYDERVIKVENANYYNPNDASQKAIETLNSPASKSIAKTATVVTFLLSASFGLLIVKLFQVFDFLKFINVKVPLNFQAFMNIFETNIFDAMPNILQVEEEGMCQMHQKLIETE